MKTQVLCLAIALLATPVLADEAKQPWKPHQWKRGDCGEFTIAAIPDTQNYVDYRHQKAEGYPFDAVEQYYEQMRWIAANAKSSGGEIVFATHLGDLWQHYSEWMDPEHEARGFKWMPNPNGSEVAHSPKKQKVLEWEIPSVVKGFRSLKGKLPFSVIPGNHDYDALWTSPEHPPQPNPETGRMRGGIRHVGGFSGYRSAFSPQSEFFDGQPWYVASNDGGADSAQIFVAGQCRFLHIGLQYYAPDASLAWAERIIEKYKGVPTIVTTHGYLERNGDFIRVSNTDNSILDHRDNNPQMMWNEFLGRHDQIFLVLSGHVGGQGHSIAENLHGLEVHQVMADYQSRWQTAKDAGRTSADDNNAVGDGWLRLMKFKVDGAQPSIEVRTYSTHYKKFSSELKQYASWYKRQDGQAGIGDAEFLQRDEFSLPLRDFHQRFDTRD